MRTRIKLLRQDPRHQRVQAQAPALARRRCLVRWVVAAVVAAVAAAAAGVLLPRPLVRARARVLHLRRERRTPREINHSGRRPHYYQTTNPYLLVRYAR